MLNQGLTLYPAKSNRKTIINNYANNPTLELASIVTVI